MSALHALNSIFRPCIQMLIFSLLPQWPCQFQTAMSLKCRGCEEQLIKPATLLGSGAWAVVQGCSPSIAQRMVLTCRSPLLMSLSNRPRLCHKLKLSLRRKFSWWTHYLAEEEAAAGLLLPWAGTSSQRWCFSHRTQARLPGSTEDPEGWRTTSQLLSGWHLAQKAWPPLSSREMSEEVRVKWVGPEYLS